MRNGDDRLKALENRVSELEAMNVKLAIGIVAIGIVSVIALLISALTR